MARLFYETVTRSDAAPSRWLALTHGIFGTGGNWRSIARKFVEAASDWGAVLIDLRGHGKSPAGPGPHTLAACAEDLAATFATLASAGMPVRALSAHSFGGKAATSASFYSGFIPKRSSARVGGAVAYGPQGARVARNPTDDVA
jgi:pimeloyl-ACP methyl ester carboxylesterase